MATTDETKNAFEGLVPQSASASASASASSSKPTSNVFINHRGPDTKHTLATSIYHTLKPMGLNVFLDEKELELGGSIPSDIQDAMTSSFLHIAILSPNYAESPWCLAELSFMLETGKKVIPVFCEVEPGDIRWGKGIYTDAFSKHEKSGRYSPEKLKEWKSALQTVACRTGCIVKKNDDEGTKKMLESIIDYIKKHPEKIPLVLPSYPVCLDEILQDFKKEAFDSSQNIKIVGIVGMGGCGKTTLAEKYYNETRFSIYRCSFIHNVRDEFKKDPRTKQKQMLENLGFNDAVDSKEIGKAILAKCLRSVQVFIVLDDVDHQDQLEYLLPIKDSGGQGSVIVEQGSVIVVTSRNSALLSSWGISCIYEMKKLDQKYAMELFCRHAFQQRSPPKEFNNLVQNFLKVCNGLPLSLKVLGGLVYGKPQDHWHSQLDKVSRVLPEDIKSILKVSFDGLDVEEKDIFLDISCFFIGIEEQLAITVWDGSGWSGLLGLTTLKNKCLVEVDEQNRIKMHDHLRDMGREIANMGKETGKISPYRLWSPQQFRDMEIEGQEGVRIRGIRGIRAETEEFYEECKELVGFVMGSPERFKRRLEILVVRRNYFTEEFATLSAGLVWLRWVYFPETALQPWLPLKNLRILEITGADKLEELWSETAEPPLELRELIISDARSFLRFPNSIGRLQHLKKISIGCGLGYRVPLPLLPEEFCQLKSLEHLDLSGCNKLRSLPSEFGHLKNLRHLNLDGSELMMLPDSFKELVNLQCIYLGECLINLQPDILENMTKLEVLHVYGCNNITRVLAHITNHGSLKTLYVFSENLMELPNDIGKLSKLEELTIGLSTFKTLPTSIGNLFSLTTCTFHMSKLESLPEAFTQLASLHSLYISDCPLTELDILSGCSPSSLCSLKNIIVQDTRVSRISISQRCCPALEKIQLRYNSRLVEIDRLPISVKTIELTGCVKLKSISGVCGLVNLERLDIDDCGPELQEFPNFKELVSLKEFSITRSAEQVKMIEGFEYCRSLETLRARTQWKVPVIRSLENTESLRRVELVEWNISALEPCLRTIKKWPLSCIICARIASGVEASLKSLTFPGLTLVDSCSLTGNNKNMTLKCGDICSSNTAAMVYFVFNTIYDYINLYTSAGVLRRLERGKWVWIGVFTQYFPCKSEEKFYFYQEGWKESEREYEGIGMAMMGEEKRVVEAFYQLLQYLGNHAT